MKIYIKISGSIVKIILPVWVLLFVASCSKYLDVNTNPDSPDDGTVTENVLLPGIEGIVSFNLVGGYPVRFPNYWIGQLSSSAEAPSAETFVITSADVNNTWTYDIYTGALKNDVLLMQRAEANGNFQYLGISKVLAAQMLAVATDLWGDIPWSEAFKYPNISKPKFDTQEFIYSEVFRLLNEGIANLNNSTSQNRYPGKDDLLFSGDKSKWVKLAYMLKARYAMHLTYAPSKTGSAQADTVLTALSKGFSSNADDATFAYYTKTDNENPWYQWGTKWSTAYANSFMVNLMKKNADPRCLVYFLPTESNTIVGHRNGSLINVSGSVSIIVGTNKSGSYVSNQITMSNSSLTWASFAEAKFLEAEAYIWKLDYPKAQKSLNDAIMAHMSKLGLNNDTIAAFLARLGTLPTSFEAAQKMIIEQKYIANFLSGENWNDYRRTGYPLVSASDTDSPKYSNIPVRFMYSTDAKLNNAENVPSVDWTKDRLWWDAKSK